MCGRTVRGLISGTCTRCYLETGEVLRIPKINIAVCPDCLRYRETNSWMAGGESLRSSIARSGRRLVLGRAKFDEAARSAGGEPVLADLEVGNVRISGNRASFSATARIDGLGPESESAQIEVEAMASLNLSLCRECQLRRSDYHACILQIRAEGRAPEEDELEVLRDIIEQATNRPGSDPMRYIGRSEERKEGLDLFIGSAALGREIAKDAAARLGGQPRESRKLIGVEKGTGKRLYRFTILLRLPALRIGDVTELGGNLYAVLHHLGGTTTLVDREGATLSHQVASGELPLIARREDIGQALVLEVRPDGVQILDPRGNHTFDLGEVPPGVKVGDTVNVIWRDDVPYLAPVPGRPTNG